jgi:peptidyl-prolyl cis-trans isomerase SurA
VVRVTQASVPLPAGASAQQAAAAQMQLVNFKSRAPTCAAVTDLGKKTEGVTVEDLGETKLSDLLPDFATALHPLKDNQTTAPMQNANEMKVLYVCDKRLAGDNAITRDDVESRLVDNRLAMLGKRYLRDLHATATIEDRH